MKRAITCLLVVLFLISCSDLSERDRNRVKSALADSLTNKTESWDVDMNLIESGKLRVDLSSPYSSTEQLDRGSETRFNGPVHISVFDTSGHKVTSISCEKAVFQSSGKIFEFFNNVIVKTDQKRTLRTEYLKWLQNSHNIQTKDYVTITTPTDSIAGYGLKGTDDLKSYTITKVTGRLSVE
ncbi:MAG TPA: LPS export ABC transporter periplasmic protein LptC [Balneolales bacterium]|nr:LPS export ABC transporter periplasmic protein LptC [Balneolales bacterium]